MLKEATSACPARNLLRGSQYHLHACLNRFFEDYKKNEHKEVKVDEILGREEAFKAIKEAMVGFLSILPI